MKYDKVITFTYTDKELKFIDKSGIDYLIPIFSLSIPMILIYFIANDNKTLDETLLIFFSIIIVLTIVASISLFVVTAQTSPKIHANFSAEQKVYFKDNLLYYENGERISSIDIRYISRIMQTKDFYRIDIELRGYGEIGKFLFCPFIPRRVVSAMEMQSLASQLNVQYKE